MIGPSTADSLVAEASGHSAFTSSKDSQGTNGTPKSAIAFAPLPTVAPVHQASVNEKPEDSLMTPAIPTADLSAFDPHADLREHVSPEEMFNPGRDQHTGIVLGTVQHFDHCKRVAMAHGTVPLGKTKLALEFV